MCSCRRRPTWRLNRDEDRALADDSILIPEGNVRISVLEAIRSGVWDYEPNDVDLNQFPSTRAMPGTREKLDVLALRAEQGLPLWHDEDRIAYDDGRDRTVRTATESTTITPLDAGQAGPNAE